MSQRRTQQLLHRDPIDFVGVQSQLRGCSVDDTRVKGYRRWRDARQRHASQGVVHLRHCALPQYQYGALHTQLVELQAVKERRRALVVVELGRQAVANGVLVAADDGADDLEVDRCAPLCRGAPTWL